MLETKGCNTFWLSMALVRTSDRKQTKKILADIWEQEESAAKAA